MKQNEKKQTAIFNYSSEIKTININPSWNSNYDSNTIYNIAYYIIHTKKYACTTFYLSVHIQEYDSLNLLQAEYV